MQEVLEPLEHSILDTALDGRPMEGIPVREFGSEDDPGWWTFREDGRLGTLVHSVLNVTLDGRPMEGIPDLEPLEHSVLVMALDSGLTEEMTTFRSVRAFGSECSPGRLTYEGDLSFRTVRALGSRDDPGQ